MVRTFPCAADLLGSFLIVVVLAGFGILEEAGLRFRRHIARSQGEAKGRVRTVIAQELR